jgi:hypothetical protein
MVAWLFADFMSVFEFGRVRIFFWCHACGEIMTHPRETLCHSSIGTPLIESSQVSGIPRKSSLQ